MDSGFSLLVTPDGRMRVENELEDWYGGRLGRLASELDEYIKNQQGGPITHAAVALEVQFAGDELPARIELGYDLLLDVLQTIVDRVGARHGI